MSYLLNTEMVFKNLCVIVFWMKVTSALEGLMNFLSSIMDFLSPITIYNNCKKDR